MIKTNKTSTNSLDGYHPSTICKQFGVKYKTLSARQKESLSFAKLIDEAMAEEGEESKEKVYGFVKKHGNKSVALTPKETKQLIERSRNSGTISMEKVHKQIRKKLINT